MVTLVIRVCIEIYLIDLRIKGTEIILLY